MNPALKWKLLVGLVLVFLAGAATGFFVATMHARHVFVEFHQPDLMAARMTDRLRSELQLTPEQQAKISPIAQKMATQLEQIRSETGERVHQAFMDAHREMSAILTDEQRVRLKEMDERHHAWHMQHGPPPPHRPPGEMPPP